MNRSKLLQWRAAAVAVFASLGVLAACGGGGGDAASQSAATPGGGTLNAPTTYSMGTISGFGSVIVGGVRFDDSTASVSDEDGNSHDRSALKLGMTVQVEAGEVTRGGLDSSGSARAHRVRFGHEVRGPVQAIAVDLSSIQILGQTVDVTPSTVIDDSWVGGLAAVTVGSVVEVHGLPDATTGRVVATRIQPRANAATYALRGLISALDSTAKSFILGGLTVSYAALANPPADLSNGQIVRVQLQTVPVSGVWQATRLVNGRRAPADGVRQAHVEGVITAYTSPQAFVVNGIAVDASNAVFSDGTQGVVLGARVEVEGAVNNGVLVASEVEIKDRRDHRKREVELHGSITRIDGVAKTFVLRDVTVSFGGQVNYKDGTEALLVVGAKVEVRGVLGADRTQLTATRIEFKAAGTT